MPAPPGRSAAVAAAAALIVAAGVTVVLTHPGRRVSAAPARARPAAAAPSAAPSHPAPPVVPSPPPLAWTSCAAGSQCSSLVVPLSWSGTDPAARGKTIRLAVVRFPATGPGTRLGSLIVNPGGPGESGVSFLQNTIDEIPAAVRARFDVVSFDPRGVGASAPVHCLSGPQLDALFHLPPYPQNPAEEAQLVAGAREEDDACAAAMGDELRHLSTVDVARDMDLLRAALGDPRLSYLGYSYGTAIGAAYAHLFPSHIRAMVLDGALDPTISGTGFLVGQAGGFETAFADWRRWCAGNAGCAFARYGATPAALGTAFDQLAARIRARPLPVGARSLGSGEFTSGVLVTLYSKATGWPELGQALAAAENGNGSILLELNDLYLERSSNGSYSNLDEANLAVNCIDRPWPRGAAGYAALADRLAGPDPFFGRTIAWSGLSCGYWPVPPVTVPAPVHARGAPPILVIATTGDPATPYREGVSLARQLDSGVLITHVGDGHTVYRVGAGACILDAVDSYLIDLQAPSRSAGLTCS